MGKDWAWSKWLRELIEENPDVHEMLRKFDDVVRPLRALNPYIYGKDEAFFQLYYLARDMAEQISALEVAPLLKKMK